MTGKGGKKNGIKPREEKLREGEPPRKRTTNPSSRKKKEIAKRKTRNRALCLGGKLGDSVHLSFIHKRKEDETSHHRRGKREAPSFVVGAFHRGLPSKSSHRGGGKKTGGGMGGGVHGPGVAAWKKESSVIPVLPGIKQPLRQRGGSVGTDQRKGAGASARLPTRGGKEREVGKIAYQKACHKKKSYFAGPKRGRKTNDDGNLFQKKKNRPRGGVGNLYLPKKETEHRGGRKIEICSGKRTAKTSRRPLGLLLLKEKGQIFEWGKEGKTKGV